MCRELLVYRLGFSWRLTSSSARAQGFLWGHLKTKGMKEGKDLLHEPESRPRTILLLILYCITLFLLAMLGFMSMIAYHLVNATVETSWEDSSFEQFRKE